MLLPDLAALPAVVLEHGGTPTPGSRSSDGGGGLKKARGVVNGSARRDSAQKEHARRSLVIGTSLPSDPTLHTTESTVRSHMYALSGLLACSNGSISHPGADKTRRREAKGGEGGRMQAPRSGEGNRAGEKEE